MSEMIEVNVAELGGPALDWAVAVAEGYRFGSPRRVSDQVHFALSRPDWSTLGNVALLPDGTWSDNVPRFSTDWAQAGPLIEQRKIAIVNATDRSPWLAMGMSTKWMDGGTPLIAAMRAIVADELGDRVKVPAELMEAAHE